jgi:hypothetical protein
MERVPVADPQSTRPDTRRFDAEQGVNGGRGPLKDSFYVFLLFGTPPTVNVGSVAG